MLLSHTFSKKNDTCFVGNTCRQFLLWDSLPDSNCEDVFVFSVRSNETTAGCALSAVPFPSLFCV